MIASKYLASKSGVLFRHLTKNSRGKKLKLKKKFSKTKGIFALKLKKPAILGQLWGRILCDVRQMRHVHVT